ncbi:hypothetical protein [Saccharopolyspora shandongensis]|uniref:hypothetical protein n=1 Tax=Saccharopolyspora shandongensis TaxID=418495 RepID=UPI003402FD65
MSALIAGAGTGKDLRAAQDDQDPAPRGFAEPAHLGVPRLSSVPASPIRAVIAVPRVRAAPEG